MANPAINFAGFLYNDAGTAVSGATVNLYDKNTVANVRATTTTDSNGAWSIAHTTAGEFDIEIVSGASKRRIKFDDKVHLSELDAETINIRANEGGDAPLYFFADEGDDAGDRWQFKNAAGGVFTMGNDINSQGTYVAHVTITPNSTVASSTFAIAGNATVGGALTVTGTTTLNGNLVLGDAAADTLTIGATLQGASPLIFEGATADGNETTFAITDPTADRTITFPDAAGTVLLTGNALSGTSLTLSSVSAAGTDTDKFLVLDSSGNVDYRTGSQVLSDIGAGTGGMTSFILEDDDGTEVTISNAKEVKIIGSGVTTNWTDTDNGTDGDPYDLTITVDAAQTGITSLLATDIKIGEDDQTKIDFETADEIHFYAANVEQVYVADNIFGPQSDSDVDLGTTGVRWKDAYIDTITTTGTITTGDSVQTATIDFTDGDNAITIADGGGVTFAQDISTTDAKYIKLGGSRMATSEPASNTSGYGIVIGFDSAGSVSQGDAVYINSSGKVAQARADAGNVTDPAIGIATNDAASDGDDCYVLTHGIWRMDAEAFDAGDPVYLGESVGAITKTAPSDDGDYVQRIGIAVTDDVLFVMPSIDVIEHA